MARYIKADALEKEGWTLNRTYSQDLNTIVYETKKLSDFQTADAVEVVRCKDCKWFNDFGCAIRIVDNSDKPKDNDFCSFGERKEA